jgi:hypothetical protein
MLNIQVLDVIALAVSRSRAAIMVLSPLLVAALLPMLLSVPCASQQALLPEIQQDALVLQQEAPQLAEKPSESSLGWGTRLYNIAYTSITDDQLARNAQVSLVLKVGREGAKP